MATKYDAVIIGTGQAGPSLAVRLAVAGMKVAIVERKLFGGPFQGFRLSLGYNLRVLAALEPWAEVSERLRRIFKLNQCPSVIMKHRKLTIWYNELSLERILQVICVLLKDSSVSLQTTSVNALYGSRHSPKANL